MKKPTETQLVKACLAYLKALGAWVWRSNTGAFVGEYKGRKRFVQFGTTGCPDIVGVLRGGRFIGVECKQPGRKQSIGQRLFQQEVERLGGLYVLAYSVDDVILACRIVP